MAQNFLYMFEFVVDDLLITRQNLCAPEEYPTCCEITFRSSVFVSICDREYGSCVNPCQPKCGKCCMFSLESPVTDKDRVLIHVYKKRTDRCKFLIGLSDLAAKPIFDRVNESFQAENPNWEKILNEHINNMPKMRQASKNPLDNCACYERAMERKEQLCPTSELSKRLLPLFNLCKMQTGNIVLIMRLVCNGPAIVSSFPFNRVCSRNPKCPEPCPSCPSCGKAPKNAGGGQICPPPSSCGGGCGGGAGGAGAAAAAGAGGKKCRGKCRSPSPVCVQPDPCYKPDDEPMKCLRYFACNLDKMCPCDYCEDEFDRACPTVPQKKKKLSPIEQRLEPCNPCGGIPSMPRNRGGASVEGGKKDKYPRQSGGGVIQVCDPDAKPESRCGKCDPCENACCPEYEMCCDQARQRAIRKLRHLLVKYNIQIE
ncbi:uncharacterized protein LOC115624683 [Scaptodrosophila lebanonensis]|uniref:Uncharacterized protein LOC115624683 n=1 Tax=Drosophila lebanonensis TaxID=7225 RepID=A0A6J2TIT2_DROLE|nr:uncharacterized protein LOC115624683 [Scaptodrosophila lebanonensis]